MFPLHFFLHLVRPPTPPRATATSKMLHVAVAKKKIKTLHLLLLTFFFAGVCCLLTQPMRAPILLESHLILTPENPQVATPDEPSRKRCSFHAPCCLASLRSQVSGGCQGGRHTSFTGSRFIRGDGRALSAQDSRKKAWGKNCSRVTDCSLCVVVDICCIFVCRTTPWDAKDGLTWKSFQVGSKWSQTHVRGPSSGPEARSTINPPNRREFLDVRDRPRAPKERQRLAPSRGSTTNWRERRPRPKFPDSKKLWRRWAICTGQSWRSFKQSWWNLGRLRRNCRRTSKWTSAASSWQWRKGTSRSWTLKTQRSARFCQKSRSISSD